MVLSVVTTGAHPTSPERFRTPAISGHSHQPTTLAATHNPKVAGSNPAPAMQGPPLARRVLRFLGPDANCGWSYLVLFAARRDGTRRYGSVGEPRSSTTTARGAVFPAASARSARVRESGIVIGVLRCGACDETSYSAVVPRRPDLAQPCPACGERMTMADLIVGE